MEDQFIVRFWGVRGGHPVPGAATVEYGGNTSCVEVQAAGHRLILDAGTGIIALGEEMARRAVATGAGARATILFSHTHSDHTQGFPYFRPAHIGDSELALYGPAPAHLPLAEALAGVMAPGHFPVQLRDLEARVTIHDLAPRHELYFWPERAEPLRRDRLRDPLPEDADGALRVEICQSYAHPRHGVYLYRLSYRGRSLVYATDTEGYVGGDRRLVDFARGADLLIHDAQYSAEEYAHPERPRQGWGHSTPEMAMEVAALAGVGRLALFHHDPCHSDAWLAAVERDLQAAHPCAFMAREGLCIVLGEG